MCYNRVRKKENTNQKENTMNALERIFIGNPIKTAVSTLENENFGFKKIHYSRYAEGYGCAVQLSRYNKELDKLQNITIYGADDGKVTKIEYRAERL